MDPWNRGWRSGRRVSFANGPQSKVNGPEMNEVFAWLKAQGKAEGGAGGIGGTTAIKWNFTKVSSSVLWRRCVSLVRACN